MKPFPGVPIKARVLITANGIRHEAIQTPFRKQWWEKSERGGSWNLWEQNIREDLQRVTSLRAQRVLWVLP